MELLQLRYFFESAKNESFAKTAESFMVPTTSVSASIKRLEKELGCKLFDRYSNGIVLNSSGKRLQQSLCLAFSELDGAVGDIISQTVLGSEIKILVRGMRRKITDTVIEYNLKYPLVSFKTSFDFGATDYESYDIIIDEDTERYPEYEKFELFSRRLRMKCGKGDPLAGRKLTLKQLCNCKFVSMGEESNLHKILMNSCNGAGFTPDISVMCNDIECYEKFIAAGIGIAVGIEKSTEKDVEYLDITDFDERYTVYCYHKKDWCQGNVKSFLNFLKSKSS